MRVRVCRLGLGGWLLVGCGTADVTTFSVALWIFCLLVYFYKKKCVYHFLRQLSACFQSKKIGLDVIV